MAMALSCTGPIARASGVTYDLRKDQPYLAYPDFKFQVPYATEGDCYARFQVRMEEMVQSIEIIRQAVKSMPSGPANVPIAEKYPLPDKATAYNSMEGLIQHFELIMPNRGPDSPVDEVYSAIESPNGELGYYLVSDGSQVAWRTRTRPPSFIHFSVFPHIIKDHLIADIVAILGSLNIIAAELDR
jgi:NADH-quinone oxidoreductase subunit D